MPTPNKGNGKKQSVDDVVDAIEEAVENDTGDDRKLSALDVANIIELMKQQNLGVQQPNNLQAGGPAQSQQHMFWDTQPMPHGNRQEHAEGPIVPDIPLEEVRAEPYTLPDNFTWSNVDISNNSSDLTELYTLLANNYVEDDDALFRFDYSPDFLQWALSSPGSLPEWIFGVRATTSNKLVAFISAVPARIQVYANEVNVVEINFLCVHKKLRAKRLAPVLIKEVTRRVHYYGRRFQAVYTAGTVLPVPVASARYYHRSLNPKKLVRVGFSRLGERMTLARLQKLYKLPTTPTSSQQWLPMQACHVDGVHVLLNDYLKKFQLKVLFTRDEVEHWLLPRERVVDSFVLVRKSSQKHAVPEVTDLISFYHLPSTILNHDDTLYAAYSFYNVATTMPLVDLMKDALILAKNCAAGRGCDVFNALSLMDNASVFEELKFGKGDGFLQYYLYNWACPEMPASQVGIVLL